MAPTTRACSDAGRGADWQIFPADENDDNEAGEDADGVVEAARKSCAADTDCCCCCCCCDDDDDDDRLTRMTWNERAAAAAATVDSVAN